MTDTTTPRVLLLTYDFPPNRPGGMTNYYDGYTRHHHVFVHVLTIRKQRNLRAEDYPETTRIRKIRNFPVRVFSFVFHSLRLIYSRRLNIVLCGSYSPFRHVAFFIHLITGTRFLIFFHGNDILRCRSKNERSALKDRYSRLISKRCSGTISNSRFTADLVAGSFAVDPACNLVCRPGLQQEFLHLAPKHYSYSKKREFRIISVGRLTARKGFDITIRALGILHREGLRVKYEIVGEGEDRIRLESLAKSEGVQGSVLLSGFAPDTECVIEKLRDADLFCMVSRRSDRKCDVEGFGIVYLEAGAAGLPSLASRSGGIPEAVLNGETGTLVEDPESPEEIAVAVRQYMQIPTLLSRHGRAAQSRSIREFSWDHILKEHTRELKKVCRFS